MTIQDLGAIGEFLGFLAILATLFYLARQTHQNVEISKATQQRTSIDQFNVYYRIMTDPSRLPAVRKGFASFKKLNSDEQAIVFGIFAQWVNYYEQCQYSYEGGLFPRAGLDAIGAWVVSMLLTPGGKEYWGLYSTSHGVDIRDILNKKLTDIGSLPEPITTIYPFLDLENVEA